MVCVRKMRGETHSKILRSDCWESRHGEADIGISRLMLWNSTRACSFVRRLRRNICHPRSKVLPLPSLASVGARIEALARREGSAVSQATHPREGTEGEKSSGFEVGKAKVEQNPSYLNKRESEPVGWVRGR